MCRMPTQTVRCLQKVAAVKLMVVWLLCGKRRAGKTTLAKAICPDGLWLDAIPWGTVDLPECLIFSSELATSSAACRRLEEFCWEHRNTKTIVWEVCSPSGMCSSAFIHSPEIYKVWLAPIQQREIDYANKTVNTD